MTVESLSNDIMGLCPDHRDYFEVKSLADGRTHSFKFYDQLAFQLVLGRRVSRIEMSAEYVREPELIQQPYIALNGELRFSLDMSFDYAAFLRLMPALADELWENATNEPFGCCSSFEDCSDAKMCLHHGDPEYAGCHYRRNLNVGRIFYGKNKTI